MYPYTLFLPIQILTSSSDAPFCFFKKTSFFNIDLKTNIVINDFKNVVALYDLEVPCSFVS